MSTWANKAGEPMMTAAELRNEAELDEMDAYDRHLDHDETLYYEPELLDPADCEHPGNLNMIDKHTAKCTDCDSTIPHEWEN